MNRQSIKQQAKEDVRKNYLPWLIVAIIAISLSILQGYLQLTDRKRQIIRYILQHE